MAANISTYLSNASLNWMCRGTAFPVIAQPYISLHIGSPTASGTGGVEVSMSGTAYSRQAINFSAIVSNTHVHHVGSVTFPQATANYGGTLSHFGIWDSISGGNLLFFGALGTPEVIMNGETFVFQDNMIAVTLSGELSDWMIDRILSLSLLKAVDTAPLGRKIGLWIGSPTSTGLGGVEVSGVNYGRRDAVFGVASAKSIANTAHVVFRTGAGGWGTITHGVLWDTAVTPHMLGFSPIVGGLTYENNLYIFPVGAITYTLT